MKKIFRPKRIGALLLLALVGGGVFLFNQWTNSPVSTGLSDTDNSSVLASQISLKELETPHFTTLIPDTLRVKMRNESPTQSITASYMLTSVNPSQNDQVGITIGKTFGADINSVSPAKLRLSKPNEYKRFTPAGMPRGAVAYENVNGYEKGVFWIDNDKYVAIVVSGTLQRESALDQALHSILVNWN